MSKHFFLVSIIICTLFLFASCSKIEDEKAAPLEEVTDVCEKMDDLKFMKYCYEKFDVNKDGAVSMTEAASVKEMTVSGISSFKGLEYFVNLVSFNC